MEVSCPGVYPPKLRMGFRGTPTLVNPMWRTLLGLRGDMIPSDGDQNLYGNVSSEQATAWTSGWEPAGQLGSVLMLRFWFKSVDLWTSTTGWWFQPLWKMLVNWDDYSQYMGKYKSCSSHHQLDKVLHWHENISMLMWKGHQLHSHLTLSDSLPAWCFLPRFSRDRCN